MIATDVSFASCFETAVASPARLMDILLTAEVGHPGRYLCDLEPIATRTVLSDLAQCESPSLGIQINAMQCTMFA